MKVIEYCTSRSLGGLELYFLSCCRHLPEKSLDIKICVQENMLIATNLIKNGWEFAPLKGGVVNRMIQLRKIIKDFRPDIIHTHEKSDLLVVGLCKFLFGTFKHVHTRQMNMPHKKMDPFHRFLYSQVDYIIAITEKLKNDIIKNIAINPSNVKRIYYGVSNPNKGDIQKIEGLAKDNLFKIGVIARIDEKKNQHLMIEAMDLLKKKGLEVSSYFIGKTSDTIYEANLKKSSKANDLDQHIHFCGFVDQPNDRMAYFDVIVLTSEEETFGLVLIEGMRAGVAVIGAAAGDVPEIIENEKTGLLFNPGNSEELAIQLQKLIVSSERRKKIALQGKKKADKQFTLEGHFNELTELFKSAII